MELSRNPAIAYRQGYKDGYEIRRADDITDGMNFVVNLMVQAVYDANIKEDGSTFLSRPKLCDFYNSLEQSLKSKIQWYVEKRDVGTTDAIDLMIYHDKEVRKKMGLPPIDYEGKKNGA